MKIILIFLTLGLSICHGPISSVNKTKLNAELASGSTLVQKSEILKNKLQKILYNANNSKNESTGKRLSEIEEVKIINGKVSVKKLPYKTFNGKGVEVEIIKMPKKIGKKLEVKLRKAMPKVEKGLKKLSVEINSGAKNLKKRLNSMKSSINESVRNANASVEKDTKKLNAGAEKLADKLRKAKESVKKLMAKVKTDVKKTEKLVNDAQKEN